MVVSTGLKILCSLLYRQYINYIHLLNFLLLSPSLICTYFSWKTFFAEYRILSWQFLSVNIWKMLCYFFLWFFLFWFFNLNLVKYQWHKSYHLIHFHVSNSMAFAYNHNVVHLSAISISRTYPLSITHNSCLPELLITTITLLLLSDNSEISVILLLIFIDSLFSFSLKSSWFLVLKHGILGITSSAFWFYINLLF
jgi:hypothetical protein